MQGGRACLRAKHVRISNIKAHLTISESEREHLTKEQLESYGTVKVYGNFFTFRPNRSHFVYVVFPASGHVNVSGIRVTRDLAEAALCFARASNTTPADQKGIIIDNITASGRFFSERVPIKLILPRLFTQDYGAADILVHPALP